MSEKITTVLWFDKVGREAAEFYVSLLPDSRIDTAMDAPSDNPSGPKGEELVIDFTLAGRKYSALNGGPNFKPNESVSFMIVTEDQEETDRLWNAILEKGGKESQCGWITDPWGFSWQITPRILLDLMKQGGARAERGFKAMMSMQKIDIATIEAAADGETVAA
jgi:predicted 3-demethylubiquinone-9 3-methyltransferase (glyoxalase superfamily)